VPFDCDDGWADEGAEWQEDKKGWCCEHYGRGCPTTTTITTTRTTPPPLPTTTPTTTTPAPTTWVLVPVPAKFDCSDGFESWMTSWTVQKQLWCCTHAQKGCIEPPTASEPYVCNAGLQWMNLWAAEKREWCCTHKQIGCPGAPVTALSVGDATASASRSAEMSLRGGANAAAATLNYDCNAELDHWRTAWGTPKQEWCCANFQRGCPDGGGAAPAEAAASRMAAPGCTTTPPPPVTQPAPLPPPVTQPSPGCSTTPVDDIDCDDGFATWEVSWSQAKKEFCCRSKGMGCQNPVVQPAAGQAAVPVAWSGTASYPGAAV